MLNKREQQEARKKQLLSEINTAERKLRDVIEFNATTEKELYEMWYMYNIIPSLKLFCNIDENYLKNKRENGKNITRVKFFVSARKLNKNIKNFSVIMIAISARVTL